MYLIMAIVSAILGVLLNDVAQVIILATRQAARQLYQKILHLVSLAISKARPQQPMLKQPAAERRYPQRQRHQPDRFMLRNF